MSATHDSNSFVVLKLDHAFTELQLGVVVLSHFWVDEPQGFEPQEIADSAVWEWLRGDDYSPWA